jgi:hypothetical protein
LVFRHNYRSYAPNPLGDRVCGGAHEPYDVVELIQTQPDVLLIEQFLEDRSLFAIYRHNAAPTPTGFARDHAVER